MYTETFKASKIDKGETQNEIELQDEPNNPINSNIQKNRKSSGMKEYLRNNEQSKFSKSNRKIQKYNLSDPL